MMAATELLTSYVKYRESLIKQYYDAQNALTIHQYDYVLTPLFVKPRFGCEYTEEPLCVNNLNDLDELTISKFTQTVGSDIYEGSELVYAHIVNVLVLTKLGCKVNVDLNLYKVILGYFGPIPNRWFRVPRGYKCDLNFKRKKMGFKVKKRRLNESRRYLFGCMYKLLNSCLYLKRSVWGIKMYVKDILNVIHYVLQYRNTETEWETMEIGGSEEKYGILSLSHFVSNMLFNGNVKPDILVSRASRWKNFTVKYFREVIIMVMFTNTLNLNGYARGIYRDFKSNFNKNFNANWNIYSSSNLNKLNRRLKYIRQFYVAMNKESPFKREDSIHKYGHPRKHIPKNSILDDRYNLEYCGYVLHVTRQLLRDGSSEAILTIIELMTHYFTYSALKVGFLKCATPYKCLRCTSIFAGIYGSLMDILEGLRALNYGYTHLFLVRMLIKNEIERLKTSFFGSYTENLSNFLSEYKFDQKPMIYLERTLKKSHYSPKFSQFLKYRMCSRFLKMALSRSTNTFIKENSVSTSSKCSWYLKLLMCVDVHVNKVDASPAINKCLANKLYLHLDQLNSRPPVAETYKYPYCGNNMLTDELEILYNIYVKKQSIHQYLSAFVLSDQLNVIQRTQACLALSKNLDYVESVLEQLVHSLVIDPGDRVINLLYISLNNERIRNKILYNLACLIHSNISTATNHKIYSFMKFIFNMLPDDVKAVYTNQIMLHSRLLELTMNLGDLPLSKRYDELNKSILEISETINDDSNLYLYEDVNEDVVKSQKINHNMNMCKFIKGLVDTEENLEELYTNTGNEGSEHDDSITDDDYGISNTSIDSTHNTTNARAIEGNNTGNNSTNIYDTTNNNGTNDVHATSKNKTSSKTDNINNTKDKTSRGCEGGGMECQKIVGIDVESVKILHSATRAPFMVTYKLKPGGERTYMYKMKDDLRQDCLVIQVKNFMLNIFRSHDLSVFLKPFLVVPYSSVLGEIFANGTINELSSRLHLPRKEFEIGGIVGFISNTSSRHSIGKESCVSIKHYFLKKYGHELSPNYIRAVDNFISSLAGYALLSFLLQVKDRHNGNLLFTTSGHIIHIDFGFILGASPAKDLQFELAPFKFTQEMVEFMGGYNSDNFKKFIDLLINSYFALRTHSNLVLTLVQLLQYSNIPCFRKSTLIKLRRRLRLNDTPSDAKSYILRKIFYALHSKTTKLYDVVQNYQQGIEH